MSPLSLHISHPTGPLESGVGVKVRQKTNYPWGGGVEISVPPAGPAEFTFFLRIPGWTDTAQVSVNGKPVASAIPGQYLPIRRRWAGGDIVRVQFHMNPQLLEANAQ